MENISKRTRALTKITLMTAFLVVASYIVIPVPFAVAGISLQTLAVNLIGLMLSPGEAVSAVLIYILLCLFGLPVGNAGQGGLHYLFGATGGFFFGFLLVAPIVSFFCGAAPRIGRSLLVTVGLGIPIMYVCAVGWMMKMTGISFLAAFYTGCAPYLLFDIAKCVAACFISKQIRKGMQ